MQLSSTSYIVSLPTLQSPVNFKYLPLLVNSPPVYARDVATSRFFAPRDIIV